MTQIIVNDIFDELKTENLRLSRRLLLMNECIELLSRYRQYLIAKCKCRPQMSDNECDFDELENKYCDILKSCGELNVNNIIEEECKQSVGFNKIELIDTNVITDCDQHNKRKTTQILGKFYSNCHLWLNSL